MQFSRTAALLGLAGLIFSSGGYIVIGKLNAGEHRRAAVSQWTSSEGYEFYTRGMFDQDLVVVLPDSLQAQQDSYLDNVAQGDLNVCRNLRDDFGFRTVSASNRTVKLECRQAESSQGQPERYWDDQEAELR